MTDLFSLADRPIVVTGGLGLLGRQFCRTLLQCGAKVASFDMASPAALNDAALEAAEAKGRFLRVTADVTKPESIALATKKVVATWGPPRGRINSAALDSPPNAPASSNGPFETYPADVWRQVLEVNVTGVFLACQGIGAAMTDGGSIINISSIYGMVSPDQRIYEHRRARGEDFYKPISYSVSKSALFNMTRYLATYWAAKRIRVNTVTFGGMQSGQDETFTRAYAARTPMGRMAQPGEYDGPIVFLLSDAASYMTGANLVVDVGWTAW